MRVYVSKLILIPVKEHHLIVNRMRLLLKIRIMMKSFRKKCKVDFFVNFNRKFNLTTLMITAVLNHSH